MQKLRITYNEACELLSIKRDALRLLAEYKYCHSYPIHYCPSTYTFQILIDYAKFLTWNEKRKPKILHNTNMTFSDQVSTIHQSYNYLVTQNAFKELNLLYLQAITQKEIGSFHGKGLNEQSNQVDNQTLIQINTALREHPVEKVGAKLRGYMSAMKKIV